MITSQTVAIVDDDESVRVGMENLLRSYGMESRVFESADSFLDDALSGLTSCILTDYQMPGRDGLALLTAVRERRPDVAVILMTAYPTAMVRRLAREGGALACLTKPVTPDALIALISSALADAGRRGRRPS